MAAILLGAVYFIMELLCGFIIPGPAIPVYIKWLYWAVRTSTQMHSGVTCDTLPSPCDNSHIAPSELPGLRTRVLCLMQNPVSYTVYGVVASQLGTVDNEFVIQVGHGNTRASFAEQLSMLHIPLLVLHCCT